MTTPDNRPVALIGAPTDAGAGRRGGSMGPEALRVAGIGPAIRRLGREVNDRGNLVGPPNPEDGSGDDHRHLPAVTAWCTLVRDAVHEALDGGFLPVVMGGDHALAIGSIAGIVRHCAAPGRPVSVLWLDAHADFNTADTSPSGNIHGMPVAVVAGHGPAPLTGLAGNVPMIDPHCITQIGIRSVDAMERTLIAENGVTVHDMRRIDEDGMRNTMNQALERAVQTGGHLHVSFDVDFLDPAIAPGVATTVPGGPTFREAMLCMEMIHDSGLMASLDIMELNPAFDEGNRTAELAVELVESLFGQQILARPHDSPRYRV